MASMSSTSRLSIGRSTGRCAVTGAALQPGAVCISVLRDLGDEGFERLDYAMESWETGVRPEGPHFFWKTIVPRPEERRTLAIDDDVLEEMLVRLEEDTRPERISFRWLVALMLLRKRRLRHLRVESIDGRETWFFHRRGETEDARPIAVVNPHLAEDDLRTLAEQLGAFVESDLS